MERTKKAKTKEDHKTNIVKLFMDKKIKAPNASGECPNCNNNTLSKMKYSNAVLKDDCIHYPAQCLTCGCNFEEVYGMEWIETIINL